MPNFPGYPLATDKTDGTLSTSDHPDHHNDVALAANDLQLQVNGLAAQDVVLAGDIDEIKDTAYGTLQSVNGAGISGTFSGAATIATISVPNYGVAGTIEISASVFYQKDTIGDQHDVFVNVDAGSHGGDRHWGTSNHTAHIHKYVGVAAGAHTVTLTMVRGAGGSGNAQVFADSRYNYLQVVFRPNKPA